MYDQCFGLIGFDAISFTDKNDSPNARNASDTALVYMRQRRIEIDIWIFRLI